MVTLNLNPAAEVDINIPIGIEMTTTFTFDDEVELTDVFEIRISKITSSKLYNKIEEGKYLSRATNVLTWKLNFTKPEYNMAAYSYELWNATKNITTIYGKLLITKTINNG